MSRRRARMVTSDDEDEDDDQQRNLGHSHLPHRIGIRQPQAEEEDEIPDQFEEALPDIETVALDSPSGGPIRPELISDDDEGFIDVSENFNPHPPPNIPQFGNSAPASSTPSSYGSASHSPVSEVLRGLGLNLRVEWLESCISGLESAVPGFLGLDSETKAKFCFEQFLNSDMNFTGGGVLPPNVDSLHLVELPGPFVLQVDEIVNLSCALRERYKNANAGPKRCLKLSMTDGVQRVFGMEYRPIKDLQVLEPAGLKVAIKNVIVRRGLLMLVPEVLEVLGGSVQDLEAARQRLVTEINKPPRGKRTRQGELPPLATRATQAAWPQNVTTDPVENNTSAQHSNNSTIQDVQVAQQSNNSTRQDAQGARDSNNYARQDVQGSAPSGTGLHTTRTDAPSGPGIHTMRTSAPSGTMRADAPSGPGVHTMRTTDDSVEIPVSTDADELPTARDTTDHPCTMESTEPSTNAMAVEENFGSAEENFVTANDVQDVEMTDLTDPLFMLSGDRELPFTYLASLVTKWISVKGKQPQLQGKIKCFLTSVIGFQYKHRKTFELRVHVEDGSLITEVYIHHSLVQERLGFTPEEVSAAMTSSDHNTLTNMMRTLRNFQIFLTNFEGILLVQLTESSDLPVAIEMTQGCEGSDIRLLLNRCLSLDYPSANRHFYPVDQSNPLDPIVLSP